MNNTNKFSIKEALSFGWQTTKNNIWLCIGAMLAIMIVSGISSSLTKSLERSSANFSSFIVNVVGWIVGSFIQFMLYKAILSFVDGKKPTSFRQLMPSGKLLVLYMIGCFLFLAGTVIGTILLVIPGILFALAFAFYGFAIVDEGVGPIEAFKKSAAITKGSRWQLFLYGLATLGIMILGAIPLLLGLFVAVPVTMFASGYIYRKLKGAHMTADSMIASASTPSVSAS